MKTMTIKKMLVIAAIAIGPIALHAQLPDPGGGYTGGDPDQTPVPFDGGLSLVIAAGVGFGVKKAYQARKQKKQEENK